MEREESVGRKGLGSECAAQNIVHLHTQTGLLPAGSSQTHPLSPELGQLRDWSTTEAHQLPSRAAAIPGAWRWDTSLGVYGKTGPPVGLHNSIHNRPCVWGGVSGKRTSKSLVCMVQTAYEVGTGWPESAQGWGWSQGPGFNPGSDSASV